MKSNYKKMYFKMLQKYRETRDDRDEVKEELEDTSGQLNNIGRAVRQIKIDCGFLVGQPVSGGMSMMGYEEDYTKPTLTTKAKLLQAISLLPY